MVEDLIVDPTISKLIPLIEEQYNTVRELKAELVVIALL